MTLLRLSVRFVQTSIICCTGKVDELYRSQNFGLLRISQGFRPFLWCDRTRNNTRLAVCQNRFLATGNWNDGKEPEQEIERDQLVGVYLFPLTCL